MTGAATASLSPRARPRPAPVSRALMLLILLLAAALRWPQPSWIEFKYDEARMVSLALGIARHGNLPLLSGGTSLGIERPALDPYLLALPLKLLGGHPEAALFTVAGLGLLAVALTYALGRRVGGEAVGLAAALYMAANPWLVFYDRKVWGHIQVVFSVLLLLLAWQVLVPERGRDRGRAVFWFILVAALQCLAHVLALIQGLSWLGAFLLAPRRWWRRAALPGLAAAAVLFAPYLWALARWWPTRKPAAGDAATAKVSFALAPGATWDQAQILFGGAGYGSIGGQSPASSPWLNVASLLGPLVLVLIGLGVVRAGLWAIRGERRMTGRLLLAWAVGPFVVLSLFGQVVIQYWTVLLPLPAIFFALGSTWLLAALRGPAPRPAVRIARRFAPLALGAALAALAVIWAANQPVALAAVQAGNGSRSFGTPLARWEEVARAAGEWSARAQTAELVVAANGADPGYQSEPVILSDLLGDPPWPRFVDPVTPQAVLQTRIGSDVQDRPLLLLWTSSASEAEAVVAQSLQLVWEGKLNNNRAPARLYYRPNAASLWDGLAAAAGRAAQGSAPGAVRLAAEPSLAPALAAYQGPAATVDLAAGQVAGLAQSGIERIVYVGVPPADLDAALGQHYALAAQAPAQAWPVRVYARPPAQISQPTGGLVAFANGPALTGTAVTPSAPAGGVVVAGLAWQMAGPPPADLKLTLQLLDGAGQPAAQLDRPFGPADLQAPAAVYGLSLPANLPAGDYRLILALYQPNAPGLPRLQTAAGADHVDVATVKVTP